jgi:hypothetical protein
MIQIDKDERVESVIRKHWFILFRDSIGIGALFFIPFFIYQYFAGADIGLRFINDIYLNTRPSLLVFAGSAWGLVIWAKLFAIWTDYYLDVWFITNKRVIDVEQKGFFHREVSTFRMDKIQDVTVEVKGIIATLLSFGNIHVQTAGESQEFVIKGIPHPKNVKDAILRLSDKTIENGVPTYKVDI